MSKEVDVIFSEERKGQFKLGQKKRVKLGYARNYLLPQNVAVLVSPENELYIQAIQKKVVKHKKQLEVQAKEVHTSINGQTIEFVQKTHDGVKLYGSVSAQDIAQRLCRDLEVEVDRYDVRLSQPIKVTGKYTVPVSIHEAVSTAVTVDVQSEPEAEPVKKKQAKPDKEET